MNEIIFKNQWVYNPKIGVIWCFGEEGASKRFPPLYEIDVDRVDGSAGVLDWMAQIFGKTWCTPIIFIGLMEAFDYLFNDVQNTICGDGIDKNVNLGELLKKREIGFRVFPRNGCSGMETAHKNMIQMNMDLRSKEKGEFKCYSFAEISDACDEEDARWERECKEACRKAGF